MINNFSVINIYESPNLGSKLSSQMLYGEKFRILNKKKNWLKIKTDYDNYNGYIKNKKFLKKFDPKFKISSKKTEVYTKINKRFKKTNKFLYFASRISKIDENRNFIEFEKNKWIKKNNLKKINYFEKNYNKIFKFFLNSKYLWGGKTSSGIDCSALVQIYFYYNRVFFPRDTKDQIKIKKGRKNSNNLKKGNIIYWKGHVAVCINSKKLIHAYGPRKKVLTMNIKNTIEIIEKTANLKVKKITKI